MIFFEVVKVVGAFLGVGFAITIPILCVGLLVETALKNKNAAIYTILEAVDAIFIVFLGLIGLYFAMAGLANMYRHNLTLFSIVTVTSSRIIGAI